MSFYKAAAPGPAYAFNPGFRSSVNKFAREKAGPALKHFFFGRPEKFQQFPTFGKEQRPAFENLQASLQERGAGGAFGDIADYYRDLLSNDNETFNAFAQPELRRFREETIPNISEQFAGLGAGGLSSSGFRNAAVSAGADLSERLAAIRANLRQQGVAGYQSLAQFGLSPFYENTLRPREPGLIEKMAPAVAKAATSSAFGGPTGGAGGIK